MRASRPLWTYTETEEPSATIFDQHGNRIGETTTISAAEAITFEVNVLLNCLRDIVDCTHMAGPHGTTAYLISDERINAARKAAQ